MNHLRPKGRAAVIVPEGIIFQSGTAHKQLRKNLVEDGLYCVASLPSGVFAPYSGVKTSILFFDNERATSAKEILFVKIGNDGFDLGATKRPIVKNDLPQALQIINLWKTGKKSENNLALYVAKSKIAENDYNLSVDRYRIATDYSNAKWPMVEIKTITNLIKERANKNEWPYLEIGDIDISFKNYSLKEKKSVLGALIAKKDNIIISKVRPTRGAIATIKENSLVVSGAFSILETDASRVKHGYLFYLLANSKSFFDYLGSMSKGITYPTCSDVDILNFKIPLPPLEIQEQIVAELDSYQKIIDGAKQITANWKPKIDIDPKWGKKKLGSIAEIESGFGFPLNRQGKAEEKYPFLKVSDMNLEGNGMYIEKWNNTVSDKDIKELHLKIFPKGTIIFPKIGAAIATNKKRILSQPATFDNNVMGIIPNKNLLSEFFYFWIIGFNISNWASDSSLPSMRKTKVEQFEILLPPLEVQTQIVKKIEAERVLVESAKKLIAIYEQKTKETIGKLWNE